MADSDTDAVSRETRLVLIGKTGCGKSTTGNTILGERKFKSAARAKSVTKQCKYAKNVNLGREICIVDTPGLYDTDMTMEEVTQEIRRCVGLSAPGPQAIILVVTTGRFTKEEQNTVQHFVERFGEGMYKYLIVLVTGLDNLEHEKTNLDEFIREAPQKLRDILQKAEDRYIGFNNRAADLQPQVRNLLILIDSTVNRNGGSHYTNEMYQEAEAKLKAREEKERLEAEAKKQEEVNRIKAECSADMTAHLERLERSHKEAMDNMREMQRSLIAAMNNNNGGGSDGCTLL